LTEESQHIHLFTIDQNTGTFSFKVGN